MIEHILYYLLGLAIGYPLFLLYKKALTYYRHVRYINFLRRRGHEPIPYMKRAVSQFLIYFSSFCLLFIIAFVVVCLITEYYTIISFGAFSMIFGRTVLDKRFFNKRTAMNIDEECLFEKETGIKLE